MLATKTKQSQVAKFRAAARDLETDDDEKRFDERLGKIAKAKPKSPEPEKPKTGK
jgi:hypothetical protein